jgi:hypothetical protein
MDSLKFRTSKKKTSMTYKHLALNLLEQMDARLLRMYLKTMLIIQQVYQVEGRELEPNLELFLDVLEYQYMRLMTTSAAVSRRRVRPIFVMIDDVSEADLYRRTRFHWEGLHSLIHCLRLDEWEDGVIPLRNGSRFGTEEILLLTLHKLAFPTRFGDRVVHFGRDWTALSRAFNWCMKYIRKKFGYLVSISPHLLISFPTSPHHPTPSATI